MTKESLIELVKDLADKHGVRGGFKIVVSERMAKRLGQWNYDNRTMSFNAYFVEHASDDEIKGVILHEIAHALVPIGSGHGFKWKQKAMEIGCEPKRCYQGAVKKPKPWKGTCPKCQQWIERYMRTRVSCSKCSSVFDPNLMFIWTPNN